MSLSCDGVLKKPVVACLGQMTESPLKEIQKEKEAMSFTESFLKALKLSGLSSNS